MNASEIADAKEQLAENLKKLIDNFNASTGAVVTNISYMTGDGGTVNGRRQVFGYKPEITVEIL